MVKKKLIFLALRPFYKAIRFIANYTVNNFYYIKNCCPKFVNSKTITLLYDLRNSSFSVGDFIYFFHSKNFFNNFNKINFAIILSKNFPFINDIRFGEELNKYNYEDKLHNILNMHKSFGIDRKNIFLFESIDSFYKYINFTKSAIYPTNINYGVFYSPKIINDYYDTYDFPFLKINKTTNYLKLRKKIGNNFLIVVQLRNKLHDIHRNSKIDVWIKVFKNYSRHNITFLIISSFEEFKILNQKIPSSINQNIFFSKSNNLKFDINDDMAAIYDCDYYFGANSGPGAVRYLSKKRFLIFNTFFKVDNYYKKNIFVNHNLFQSFIFANKQQMFTSRKESFPMIIKLIDSLLE